MLCFNYGIIDIKVPIIRQALKRIVILVNYVKPHGRYC